MVRLVAGKPDQFSTRIAELIWSEDPALIGLEYQSYENWVDAAQKEWPVAGVANSYDSTTLAMDGAAIVGLINGFPANEIDARLERSSEIHGPHLVSDDIAEAIDTLFAEPIENAFYVLDIAVHACAQNTGLGGRLMDHADQMARSAGCTALYLDTYSSNVAVGFYQHIGFQITQQTNSALLAPFGVEPYLQMVRPIS